MKFYIVGAILFLFFCVSSCRKRKRLLPMEYEVNNQTLLAADILSGLEETTNVLKHSKHVWSFTSGSQAIVAPPVAQKIRNAVNGSLTIHTQTKHSKRGKVSIISITSFTQDQTVVWLEVLVHPRKSTVYIHLQNTNLQSERLQWQPQMNIGKKWLKLMIHIDINKRSVGISDAGGNTFGAVLMQGINLQFPSNMVVQVGGSPFGYSQSFVGLIKQLDIIVPGMVTFSNLYFGDKNKTILKKRGATRKPGELSQTRSHSTVFNHVMPNTTIMEPSHPHLTQNIAQTIEQLESDVQACRMKTTSVEHLLSALQQSLLLMEQRVLLLESCECTRKCQGRNGQYYTSGDEWEEEGCLTCTCIGGIMSCNHSENCGNSRFCDQSTCKNGGICTETNNGFVCQCVGGFHGNLCQFIDHCYSNICQNGGTCIAHRTQYRCECLLGYTGRHCELRDWCSLQPCQNGGMCINNSNGHSCQCHLGFTGNNCEFKDMCLPSPCENKGICERMTNKNEFQCLCLSGYVGKRCELPDSCADEPCMNGALCKNTATGFHCSCTSPYSGQLCETSDACHSSPCFNGGLCELSDRLNGNGYRCTCPTTHIGLSCESINHCISEPCMNNGLCTNLELGFSCRCRGTHYGDRCEHANYCRAKPCYNEGMCSNTPLNENQPFTCTCKNAYSGSRCEIMDLCASDPCLNSGTCSNNGTSFVCKCQQPYIGHRCEVIDYCVQNPCLNGGVCVSLDNGFECRCLPSHYGRRCEKFNSCRNNPCLNGGICSSTRFRSYTCQCPPTHYGTECQLVNGCYTNPCLNGGTCLRVNEDFTCQCTVGFYGKTCSITNWCSSVSCENGGSCLSVNGTASCLCPSTHRGNRCQFSCNICLYSVVTGSRCSNPSASNIQRWYFDQHTQNCKQFSYKGCGGNANNFNSRQECRQRCMVGACCLLRKSNFRALETVCRKRSISQCKRTNIERHTEFQVISFKTGDQCSQTSCGVAETCMFGGTEYETGSAISLECGNDCTCSTGGVVSCSCTNPTIRREIRQMTSLDMQKFHSAVRNLKMTELEGGGNIWDVFRDEYANMSPLAQSGQYFLLWNRAFLKKVEMMLQKSHCDVVIPFFDFTIDAGKLDDSVVWQPNYFGGEGSCIPDNPFRVFHQNTAIAWEPCLSRHFNRSVTIPNIVDVAMAMSTTSDLQLSNNLLNVISHVKAFIGGDMSRTSSAYDPIFYSIHAYIDYLYMEWQKRNNSTELSGILNNAPIGFTNQFIKSGACASYIYSEETHPCNMSDLSSNFGPDGFNMYGFNADGFNRQGYDHDGFNVLGLDRYGRQDYRNIYQYNGYNAEGYNRSGVDRMGYNQFGFKYGYNRDGYDTYGFNHQGVNRYGLDTNGYDKNGFDIYGVSPTGRIDHSDFFDQETGFSDCCFTRDGFTVAGIDRFGFTASGYNLDACNNFFNGPHVLYYRHKLWKILSVQPVRFLMTLSRNCGKLQMLPSSYIKNNWVVPLGSHTRLKTQPSGNTTFSQRFCMDVDALLTWCPCLEGTYPATCQTNPCYNLDCPLHPTAKCHINVCGDACTSEFYLDGRRVNCENPCISNPCLNGGTCHPSPYSSAAERFSCDCLPQYAGSLCEQQAADTCTLPKFTGNCNNFAERWYFSFESSKCISFQYSGCNGNANNFPNKQACDLRCSVGACCYKKISNVSQLIGFDSHGFDKYGFNTQGYNRAGQKRSPHNSMPYGNQILGHKGFGPDGFNIYGYNENGLDRQGYDWDGYHRITGYNRTGFNRLGEYDQLTEYDESGYDHNGFDRSGHNCNGLDLNGYNRMGLYHSYSYECRSMALDDCQSMSHPFEVVAFSAGLSCNEVSCGSRCGCELNGNTYQIGETVTFECQTCKCTLAGSMNCVCRKLAMRKEIRDLTNGELQKYSLALQKVYLSGEWDYYVSIHSQHMKSANGGSTSLPWHRHYLASVERELRKQSDCDVSIPYFDWTIDVGSLNASYVWSVKYFGGNGEKGTNCVRYHSFGGSQIWQPCIRRQFNASVSLPDAVDIQILLHEPSYESFRIQLETFSALFHLWVGGHMISPFSPYDPLFLSHWAFMDLLWTEWQMKNPEGISRYPILHRYQMLEPFDVTPDDVLSTRKQICVYYVPPTIGSPCNLTNTRHSLARNMDGFDRHGFDVNGYDVEGFNAQGLDHLGNVDERKIYDSSGYLSDGYDRSGFDPQGWDRFGFLKSDFNRDGIDIEGYDQSGFDQFGFDRNYKSAFGMFKNGTYDVGVDIGQIASLFDEYGYNKYGYDKYGLDHNGYTPFGYNIQGYDNDRCNYYSIGPYYMRYFYFAQIQFKNLQPNHLYHIKRICQPVTVLPKWISQSWLGNWKLVQSYQNAWLEKRAYNLNWNTRNSSVTEENLWKPLTPDKQFCFDLQWYSGCPLGTPLVECDKDYCGESQCASNPQAQCKTKRCGTCYPQFFNGSTGESIVCFGCIDKMHKVYPEGAIWQKLCESCVCQGGMISCNRKSCASISCSHPVVETGECCESCSKCFFNGTKYNNGEHFRHGNCDMCQCLRGSVTCRTTNNNCPPTPCRNPIKLPGECCPSCPTSCGEHGEGQKWMSDDCQLCTCTDNFMNCSKVTCPQVECSHPLVLQSQCCPTCTGCNFHGRVLRNGQQFTNGCLRCLCSLGNVNCVAQQCPPLSCQRQTKPHGSCCPVCEEGCEHENRFYLNGESFHPLGSRCRNCTCVENEIQCRGTACFSVGNCPRPTRSEDGCCPTCSGCTYDGHFYRNYQAWRSEDSCHSCICRQGNIECSPTMPCRNRCTNGLTIKGQCCKDCSRCLYKSRIYLDGEEFADNNDACQKCTCQGGNITCITKQCSALSCQYQQDMAGECCPRCRPCFYDGKQHLEGESWRLPDNPCTSCLCSNGQLQCQTERCPHATCDNPLTIPDSCCQSCDGCSFEGGHYLSGDIVMSGKCDVCICEEGTVSCEPKQCETITCPSQVTLQGDCCPSCMNCTYEGKQFGEGSEYFSMRNPCLKCVCQMGETICNRIDSQCPILSCSHPGRVQNQCCRQCNMCEYERRNYRNGETFNPPHSSACLSCTCIDGSVTCNMETCKAISCSNPSTKPGKCCPTCLVCEVNGVLYDTGSTWSPDACTSCVCKDGEIVCQLNDCPTPNCTHPSQVPGYCCPACQQCSFLNRIFENHQQFIHPENPCEQCNCKDGSVICNQQTCPPVECDQALVKDGECCPSCPAVCTITETLSIPSGQVVLHPDDKCMSCSCTDGKTTCSRRCITPAPCSHPTHGLCCRDSCDGCFYRGHQYENGQNFHHALNPCRMCQCNNGNVRCFRKRCNISCKVPQLLEGQCCPVCHDSQTWCNYNNATYSNMEQFNDGCNLCTCISGEVSCQPKICPSFQCTHPQTRSCCRRCDGCVVNEIEYQNEEELPGYSTNACTSCRCSGGNVACQPLVCPSIDCLNPVNGECCPQCLGCLYLGVEYTDGMQFRPRNDNCQECICHKGSVSCQRELCLNVACSHPITNQDSCCPVCGSACLLSGVRYEEGYSFTDPTSSCRTCVCSKGSIQCHHKTCLEISCRNPAMGTCNCSVCNECIYDGAVRRNHETFTNPEDEKCSDCYCQDGNVLCGKRPCHSSTCTHPTLDVCGCPLCDSCSYFDEIYNNTSQFPDIENTCNLCHCEDGNVECISKQCKEVRCNNPGDDGCGCPFCLHCSYMGIEYDNNEQFVDSMNKCNQCTCHMGTVHCVHVRCPSVPCSEPVMPIGECCPRCVGTCVVNGETIENGADYTSPTNPCNQCTCSFGSMTCVQQQCGKSCTHPIPGSDCCQDCSGCYSKNQRYKNGQVFVPQNNNCLQCSCTQGNVVCHEMQCPLLSCTNSQPVHGQCCPKCPQALTSGCYHNGQTKESGTQWIMRDASICKECVCTSSGQTQCITMTCDSTCSHPVPVLDRCCPSCESCFYNNQTYPAGQLFHPDPCRDCICNQGSVHCVIKACRPINCPQNIQVHVSNTCCPKCASCIDGGNLYFDGQVWTVSNNPCSSCQCHNGVITCRTETCLTVCQSTIQIPNVCCPACAGCVHNHQVYEIGDTFERSPMNPCEMCQCILGENGLPAMVCHQALCPSLADCPRSCVRQPPTGTCCPHCADECSFGNCNQDLRIASPEDVCLNCKCNHNDTWVCSSLECPNLDCPASDRYTPKNSCCQVCDKCYLSVENTKVANGERWYVNECTSCRCTDGTIVCEDKVCPKHHCAPPRVPYKQAGKCCEECVDPDQGCMYEGHSVVSRHQWLVDKCTTCHCFAGKVNCYTKICRMLMCNADEVATVVPGECCPTCIANPGTCVAFGDPHFRTFDGRLVTFQGTCKYLLTADCMFGDFRVEVKNTDRGGEFGQVSWIDKVYITVFGHRIVLNNHYGVSINGTTIPHLPFLLKPHLFIDKSGSHILLNTEIGVLVMWDSNERHLQVNVPSVYKRKTCGLCGNFNNYPQDDLRMQNSRIATDDVKFGNNWKVNTRNSSLCPDAVAFDPCAVRTYAQRKYANRICKLINSEHFAACHQVVSPDIYFGACVHDVCACGQNDHLCSCGAIEAYAAQCRKAGVIVHWRSRICFIQCPTERGYIFDECGSPCKRTCANKNLPPNIIAEQCYMPCVSGCQCPAGKVEHHGRCINPSDCPEYISSIQTIE